MLGEGLSVCPITLLFKDHKGWDNSQGSVPPTRHVAGGHVGLNMNLSEIVSDVIEPLVGTMEGGFEVISTEDMLARIEWVNYHMRGWKPASAWEGVREGKIVACSTCPGTDEMWLEGNYTQCGCSIIDDGSDGKFRIRSNLLEKINPIKGEQHEERTTYQMEMDDGTA